MKYIFLAGAPGSKWSSVCKNIYFSKDINHTDYKDTPRFIYNKEMIKLENNALNLETQSIGNINEVISIRNQRVEEDIKYVVNHFELGKNKITRIRTDVIIEPLNNNYKLVSNIRKKINRKNQG